MEKDLEKNKKVESR